MTSLTFSTPTDCEQGANICSENFEKKKSQMWGKLESGAALVTASAGQEACAQDLPGMTKSFSINTHLNAGMWERYAKSTQWQTHSGNAFIPEQPNWKVWGHTWQQAPHSRQFTECCVRPWHPATLLKVQQTVFWVNLNYALHKWKPVKHAQ